MGWIMIATVLAAVWNVVFAVVLTVRYLRRRDAS